jgi:parallel beta-helix repeat protein
MKKELLIKTLALSIVILFVGAGVVSAFNANLANESKPINLDNWLYVGGSGPENYTRIQDAIDNASNGDVVFVYNESSPYSEIIWINISISLLGENRDSTIIKGKEDADIITINKDAVTVKGFTIQGIDKNSSGFGIGILTNNIVISDNIFKDTSMGIYAISDYSTFTQNEFSSLCRGMWLLYSHNCLVADNNFGCNLYEDITAGGSNCVLNNNTFTGRYGLKIWKNNQTVVSNNTFLNSCMIDFYESYSNVVYGNTFVNGSFTVYKSNHNSVFNNTRNDVPIVYFDGEKDKIIDIAAQVILVQCENIKVLGITFTDLPCGIYLENTKNSNISENNFLNCTKGISLYLDCWQNLISNCEFNACSWGITIQSHSIFNSILGNIINDSHDAAILIDSSFNRISNNTISNALLGISLTTIHPFQQPTNTKYRRGNLISFNTVQDAWYGIVIDACFTDVKSNKVSYCTVGIGVTDLALFSFDSITGNIIQGNVIDNNLLGLELNLTVFTTIKKNNFVDNDQQVSFYGLGLFGQIVGTRWIRNYWGQITLPPKVISGVLYVPTGYGDKISYKKINWIEFDWLPAQSPYDISIGG